MTFFSGRLLIRNVSMALPLLLVSVLLAVLLPEFSPSERRRDSPPEPQPIRNVSELGKGMASADRARQALMRAKSRAGEPDFLMVAVEAMEEFRALTERFQVDGPEIKRLFADAAALALKIGRSLEQAQRFEEARTQYRRGLEWVRLAFPRGHPMTVQLRGRLAAVERMLGNYSEAQSLLNTALLEARQIDAATAGLGRPPLRAAILNELGVLARAQGAYREAMAHYGLALDTFQALLPPTDLRLAVARNNLAVASQWHGDYEGSREQFESALRIYRLANGDDVALRSDAAMVEHSLAGLLQTQGEYELAGERYRQALETLRGCYTVETHPLGHPRLATACTSLGMLYTEIGEPGRAIPFHREALQIRQRLFGADRPHPDVASSFRHLGNALREVGELKGAADALDRGLTMRRVLDRGARGESDDHPLLAETLRDRGSPRAASGQWELAETDLREAAEMFARLFPEDAYPAGHPDLAGCLQVLGEIRFMRHDLESARESLERSIAIRQQFAEQFLESAAEAEARNYVHAHLRVPPALFQVWEMLSVPASDQYDRVWRSRRVMQRVLAARQRWHVVSQGESQKAETVREYSTLREQLSALSLLPAESLSRQRSARVALLRELTSRKEELERKLAKGFTNDASLSEQPRPSPASLPADSAWIDLIESPNISQNRQMAETRWIAFIGHADGIDRVDVGPRTKVERLVEEWEWAIRRERDAPETAKNLASLIWEPLRERLPEGVSRIYLCPDGVLARLAWPALPSDDGTPLIVRYNLQLVPSVHWLSKQLARSDNDLGIWVPFVNGRTLLVGDVAYGLRTDNTPEADVLMARDRLAQRSSDSPSQMTWEALPGSKQEVLEIENLLRLRLVEDSLDMATLSGNEATVDAVLEQLGQSQVAHLATHGFFIAREADFAGDGSVSGRPVGDLAFRRNPLLASGLVFADSTNVSTGGVALAETIAGRSMPDLRLVVLSACDSGNGRLIAEEGVYGLQQAFHLAGARHVVASRWKVDDLATKELMVRFYSHLVTGRLPVAESLREAQLEMIHQFDPTSTRARGQVRPVRPTASRQQNGSPKNEGKLPGQTLSPYFWAGFAASGA